MRHRKGLGVLVERLPRQHVDPDALDARRRAGEAAVDQHAREADRLEDLRPVVGLDGRDAHLRDRLEQALGDALDDVLLGGLDVVDATDLAVGDQLAERLEHQVRVDRARPVADQRREVVDLARLPGLEHQARLQARALAHEVVVHAADGQQRRHRDPLRPGRAVGEDEHVDALGQRGVGLCADAVERCRHAVRAVLDGPRDVERARLEDLRVDLAEVLQLVVAQDRRLHRELAGVLRRLVEQVALGADAGRHAHHDRLADRVDRRVGDLREQLLEVREERRVAVAEHGERQVVAHRADRLLALAGGRRQQDLHVLLRVAERELELAQRLLELQRLALRQVGQVVDPALEPLEIGPAGRNLALDLAVLDDAAAAEVDQEDVARLQAALAQHVLGRHVDHAGLGAQHDPAVLGLEPATRPQAVAVERGADHAPVGEGDRRRAVPRLHQAAVEGVEAPEVVGHVLAALVGLGDHHHHRVREAAAGQREQLEHVVERRRVGPAGADDRQDLRKVVAEQLGGELRLARAHPVDVAAQRVDLAVVGDHPVRVRELPAREGVGGEAGVDERERRLRARVLEVGVVAQQLRRREHPLVDDGPRGEARDHEVGAGGQLGHAADHVELALEGVVVLRQLALGRDDQVLDVGRVEVGGDADVVLVDRDVAPADDLLALVGHRLLEQRLELRATVFVLRQEADAHAVCPTLRQRVADDAAHELVGHLEQDPGTVAGVRVRPGGAAVLQVLERHDGPLHRLVRRLAAQTRHESDAAGIVLVTRVVEADRTGRSWHRWHRAPVRRRRRYCGRPER